MKKYFLFSFTLYAIGMAIIVAKYDALTVFAVVCLYISSCATSMWGTKRYVNILLDMILKITDLMSKYSITKK